jgi:uncharacterized protein (TIGR02145 family)
MPQTVQVQHTEIEFISILPVAENDSNVYNTIVMKKVIWIYQIFLTIIIVFLAAGCKKEEITGDIEYKVTHWPIVKALDVTNIKDSTATLNGTVYTYGLSTTITFDYGTTESYGSTATACQSPVRGDNFIYVSADISGLAPGTPYHFRVRAENALWTNFYSRDMEFAFPSDADGNSYNTIAIGRQIWLVENLKTTTYLNGDPISSNLSDDEWITSTFGAFKASGDIYGNLYNAYAVADERKICPAGWHVPTASEWDELLLYLGGEDYAGGPMKESGTNHWLDPNVGATNESGFTALPSGFVSRYGNIISIGSNTAWWSSSKEGVWYWTVQCSFASTYAVRTEWEMYDGLSVRCMKDNLNPSSIIPFLSLSTSSIAEITDTTAKSGGNIFSSGGGATITSRGVCWSTTAKPTTSDSKTVDEAGIGQYVSNITGLTASMVYHVRAYATNSAGTRYGDEITFSTRGVSPFDFTPTTQPATNVSLTVATLNGTVNPHNLSTLVTFEYGTTKNYGQEVTSEQDYGYITGDTITNIYAIPTLLKAGTTYHFRVKAKNSLGIYYGSDAEFTTLSQAPPTVNTFGATNITSTAATLTGDVIANNLPTVVTFEYGTTTNYGQNVTSELSPASGDTITSAITTITGLTCGTYHFRIRAENSLGVAYGNDMTFNTKQIPTLTTTSLTVITDTTAISGGNITDEGCSEITDRGVSWAVPPPNFNWGRGGIYMLQQTLSATSKRTHDGTGTGSFASSLKGLKPNTTYFVRAYAKNSAGTAYGNIISFKTQSSGK